MALLVLLAVWAFGLGGGDSGNQGKGDDNKPPVSTITPGPTESGPTVPGRPGGRDETTDGGGSEGGSGGDGDDGGAGGPGGGSDGGSGWQPGTGGSGSSGSASSGSGSSDASGSGGGGDSAGGGSASGGSGSGSGPGSGSGSAGGAAVPAGSDLPGCGSGVTVSLRSVHKEYKAKEKPKFELTAKNKRGTACKLDLGREASVVTIKDADGKKVWASDDCVRGEKPALYQVPASGTSVHTFTWYREPSAADCGTPSKSSVGSGDYEIEVDVKGLKKLDASFELT
ncbi:hypothetical protein K378_05907 [Streptomyces sp. Amel2xB2]|nr:hypothetical protein K378_05907 [Streptomyces sp. Amel2xB2]